MAQLWKTVSFATALPLCTSKSNVSMMTECPSFVPIMTERVLRLPRELIYLVRHCTFCVDSNGLSFVVGADGLLTRYH